MKIALFTILCFALSRLNLPTLCPIPLHHLQKPQKREFQKGLFNLQSADLDSIAPAAESFFCSGCFDRLSAMPAMRFIRKKSMKG